MALLLDTNIVVALVQQQIDELSSAVRTEFVTGQGRRYVSAVSLWEMAIKFRVGKLVLNVPPAELPGVLGRAGIGLISITVGHVLAELDPPPATRDPFDRLLLAQCAIDGLKLLTTDRALSTHPLSAIG